MNTNSALAIKFPSRSREAIKLRRQTPKYKTLLQQVCESQAAENIEGSDDFEMFSSPEKVTIEANSICVEENNHNPHDRPCYTQRGTDITSHPNIREYVQDNIINGRIKVCNTM
jgi:hypothetical protein